ncbi:MAG TPA: class I SAM-dependent methyltransferase [Bacteroidota bacterium]|jgi:ubiquinone/menaquinone biosynthesis C-methylase UbiE|nr:class I SAM-dependent methyltransferase [Bacteroidota bacterium]
MSASVTYSAQPFDAVAGEYDAMFEENQVTSNLRRLLHGRMLSHFTAGDRVLDLNCGTGTDAVFLAQHGVTVSAVDISPAMIDRTREKCRALGLANLVSASVGSFEDAATFPPASFEGIVSMFGGLNCTPNLRQVAERAHGSLKSGGVLLACVMNRVSVWEITSFLARGKFGRAFRRFRAGAVHVPLGAGAIPVWYYSPRRFAAQIDEHFTVEAVYGLSIVSPPPNSGMFQRKHPRLTASLLNLDEHVRRVAPLKSLGDHFVVEARKK